MRFVAYYRVSTDKQGLQGNGIEAQKQSVSRYLKTLDCELVGSFEEVESGGRNDRPKLQEAIKIAKAQKAILVVSKLDRLSRNAAFLLQLQDSKLDFIICDMPNIDRFSVGILALLAQKERELISERTKAGLAVAKSRGAVLGNPSGRQALKSARAAIQARKAVFVSNALKAIEEIQSTGVTTLAKLAACLNMRGEKSPRGKAWTPTAVRRVLAAG